MSSLSRRNFLALSALGIAAVTLPSCGRSEGIEQTAELLTSEAPLPKPFTVPLPVPEVKKPVRSDATTDYYEITQRVADVEILPGRPTPVFGYDGTFPGPTIRSRSGRRTVVTHHNKLDVPTVVHLHGGHTPAEHDGFPTDLILPEGARTADYTGHGGHPLGDVSKGSRDYVYPLKQPAATLWYHDHRMDFTGPQVWYGLAGFHLVHDEVEDELPLPRDERDIPLMICDRAFDGDGRFRYPAIDQSLRHTPGVLPDYMEGVVGDVVLVNGAPWPVLEVDAARYRFRLLNASNARRYRLRLDGGASFVQIGSDLGLLDRPVKHDYIDLSPAERSDVVVDFSGVRPGTRIVLRNDFGNGSTAQVMAFVVGRKVADDSRIPNRLVPIEKLDPTKAVRRRTWHFTRGRFKGHEGWTINNRPFDPDRMDARPRLGELEVWRFYSDLHHPVHIHLAPFQIVSRGGHPPGEFDRGWKDTVDVRPAEYVDVAVRFTGYTGRYMLHCHNLEHEDMAMMSAFETVA
ncbi:multicopper oxidase domain-containing protein [Thermocrispum municipale]|uniref:multicopper oxidase domain-containing protein n=1 Tax=Thermocrispum municipale TaxID=37926 RepID=UPI00040F9710|nr:multicopper oxidase domain-containing protein [Thermocrispum municipale]